MSDQIPSKNDLDSTDTSSWEVLSEKDSSRSSSIENLVAEESDKPDSQVLPKENHVFIDLPEDVDEKPDDVVKNTEATKEHVEENKSNWRKSKSKFKNRIKSSPEKFTAISIAACILTITGLTLLCYLFPSETNKVSLELIQNDYFQAIQGNTEHVREAFNKTSEILENIYNSSNFFNQSEPIDDFYIDEADICSNDNNTIEENIFNMNFFNNNFNQQEPMEQPSTSGLYHKYSLKDLQNTTSNLLNNIKNACLNPTLHVFLCSLMQDVCLIKLIQHLERKQTLISKITPVKINKKDKREKLIKKLTSTKSKNFNIEKKSERKLKLEQRSMPHLKRTFSPRLANELSKFKNKSNIEVPLTVVENGKSECERRFEELETKWQSLGKNHRQKLQEIKEEFRTELFQMKGKEKEFSLRRQKIKLIRDKYIQKLKTDREKYLMQLKKIKEERQRVMKDICHNKTSINQARDASVKNYGFLMPQFDFKENIQNLNRDVTNATKKQRSATSFSPKKFEEYSNFWKNISVPKEAEETLLNTKNKKKTTRKDKLNNNVSEKLKGTFKNTEISHIQNIVTKLLTNLTESLDHTGVCKIKQTKKVSKLVKNNDDNNKNVSAISQYMDSLNETFLPTVSRTPSKKSKKREQDESSAGTKSSIVPFSSHTNNSCSFRTTALQSPSSMNFPLQRTLKGCGLEENKISESEIIPIQSTSLKSSSFSTISSSRKYNKNESIIENSVSDIIPFGSNSEEEYLMEKRTKKQSETDIPFKRGFNESYSFIPIVPKNLTSLKQKKITKEKLSEDYNNTLEEERILRNSFIIRPIISNPKIITTKPKISSKVNVGDDSLSYSNISINDSNKTYNPKDDPFNISQKSVTLRSLLKKARKASIENKPALVTSTTENEDQQEFSDKNIELVKENLSSDDIIEKTEISTSSRLRYQVKQSLPPESVPGEENVNNQLKLVLNGMPKKQDIYQILFDKNGKRIRKTEELLENQHRRYPSPFRTQMLSKQDPKLPKKVYLFKGRL